MKLFLTAQVLVTGYVSGLPTCSIVIQAANPELYQVTLVNMEIDTFQIVPSGEVPAIGGGGTFLSITEAEAWFVDYYHTVLLASANSSAGGSVYTYGGFVPWTLAPVSGTPDDILNFLLCPDKSGMKSLLGMVAADISDFSSASDTRIGAQKGAVSGIAPLNGVQKIDATYLPSYVDDVLEYANLAAFPGTGETGKIYVDDATAKIYRWSGTVYVEISPSNNARTTSSLSLSLVGTGATGTQISATKDSTVRASVSTQTTATIGGPSTSKVDLKMCATNDATEANWTTIATLENDQTVTLALTFNSVQKVVGQLCADIPAGYFAKLVNSGSGTHAEVSISAQKTIYG